VKRALLVLALLAGCVAPRPDDTAYEERARRSASDVASAVATALLGVHAWEDGKAARPYLSVLIGGAEEDASAVEATFASSQPPSRGADAVRERYDRALSDAVDALSQLRIAVRRGAPLDGAPLQEVLSTLEDLS
jgi:hypothetical protein